MKKILLPFLCLLSASVGATDVTEEAIQLNMEMQFMEEMADKNPVVTPNSSPALARSMAPKQNLESTYFGDEIEDVDLKAGEDEVSTKAAARRRRGDF